MTTRFIVIEGLDNVGKTSTAHALTDLLNQSGETSRYYKTPPKAFAAATNVINHSAPTDAHYLYHAAMLMMAEVEIRKHLQSYTVVCDRWIHSTIAYHEAYGSRIEMNIADLILMPDLEVLLIATESERLRRGHQKINPDSYDLVSQSDDRRVEGISRQMLRLIPNQLDTTSRSISDVARLISLM